MPLRRHQAPVPEPWILPTRRRTRHPDPSLLIGRAGSRSLDSGAADLSELDTSRQTRAGLSSTALPDTREPPRGPPGEPTRSAVGSEGACIGRPKVRAAPPDNPRPTVFPGRVSRL